MSNRAANGRVKAPSIQDSSEARELKGPDLKLGVDLGSLEENSPLLGHFEDEEVILVRQGDNIFAIGATCTHYGGPLSDGLVVSETIRCPWHHARFSLLTGEAKLRHSIL